MAATALVLTDPLVAVAVSYFCFKETLSFYRHQSVIREKGTFDMLYDKRWEKTEIKSGPFSLESLIAWLEKQPADKKYEYCDYSTCLIAQYLMAHGVKHYQLLSTELAELGWLEVVNPRLSEYAPTFGAALERARKLVAS